MTFNDFSKEIKFGFTQPADYNYYTAFFTEPMSTQQFIQYAYEKILNLENLWVHKAGNLFYMAIEKDFVLPENFAPYLEIINFIETDNTEETE